MVDTTGEWIRLGTFEEFDNGLDELIDLWSSSASQSTKASALSHFKENLDAVTLEWRDNRAKSKKYADIAQELAEFEAVLAQDGAEDSAFVAPANVKQTP